MFTTGVHQILPTGVALNLSPAGCEVCETYPTLDVTLKLECLYSLFSLEVRKRLGLRLFQQLSSRFTKSRDAFHFDRTKEDRRLPDL